MGRSTQKKHRSAGAFLLAKYGPIILHENSLLRNKKNRLFNEKPGSRAAGF